MFKIPPSLLKDEKKKAENVFSGQNTTSLLNTFIKISPNVNASFNYHKIYYSSYITKYLGIQHVVQMHIKIISPQQMTVIQAHILVSCC